MARLPTIFPSLFSLSFFTPSSCYSFWNKQSSQSQAGGGLYQHAQPTTNQPSNHDQGSSSYHREKRGGGGRQNEDCCFLSQSLLSVVVFLVTHLLKMAKKKGEYSVLYEVNTEDEWLGLCEKEVLNDY